MKRLLCIFCLLLVLICVLAACRAAETPNTESGNQENAGQNGNPGDSNDKEGDQNVTHTHAYGAWSVSRAASCTATGEEKRTCACGESETREIAMFSHSYGAWSVSRAASCTATGEEKRTCGCGESETREIAMLSHSYGAWSVSQAASCMVTGEKKRTCVCGDAQTQEIPLRDHTLAAHGAVAATCTTAGSIAYWECGICQKYFANESGTAEIIDKASVMIAASHTLIHHPEKAADCTTGNIEYWSCSGCEAYFSDAASTVEISNKASVTIKARHTYNTDNVCTQCATPLAFSQGLRYDFDAVGASYTVKAGTATEGDVVIPPYHEGKPVRAIAASGFRHCSGITSIEIPDSVTFIGKNAFSGCTALIQIENGVSYVDQWVIAVDRSVTSVTLRADTVGIGYSGFYNCTNLTSLEMPASMRNIAPDAFTGCRNLIQTENGVSYVDKWAIDCDTSVTDVALRADTVMIGNSAFSYCSKITRITIPSSVKGIATNAFYECAALTEVIFSADSELTSIGDWAFYHCGLQDFDTPTGVTRIGYAAFWCCIPLKNITIPDGVTNILDGAFYGCSNLQGVKLPANATRIGRQAFQGCKELTSIEIPTGVTCIDYSAFWGCDKLIEVCNLSGLDITAGSLEHGDVGYYARNIYTATAGESKLFTDANGYRFYDDGTNRYLMSYTGDDTALTLPRDCKENAYEIYQSAFSGRNDITSVSFPEGCRCISLGREAFYGCEQLASVSFAAGGQLATICDFAFQQCSALTSMSLPAGLQSIGISAFESCVGLVSVEIPASVTTIDDLAFNYCIDLTSVTFAADSHLSSIGGSAFCRCQKLTDFEIPASVTRIGRSAFSDCTSLLQRENGIVYMGRWVIGYYDIKENTTVILREDTVGIASYAFRNCDKLTSIQLPVGLSAIGVSAFDGCYHLASVMFAKDEADGWQITSADHNFGSATLPATDLSNTSTAAKYLCSTYARYNWVRTVE